eukprot:CAMPEP_0194668512 /NCGR_PEP_ID=MMETSP0295-20121207/4006_1 /TAXON_ID=39354 /ORGANISM="Heterosigma akashiwo, Strain CCMP2393" /LENGTH=54 /DNA_ID=CAMNT_0039551269 /DNA_START=62 /DNA_END=223 /DNA_ORIENTATION=-
MASLCAPTLKAQTLLRGEIATPKSEYVDVVESANSFRKVANKFGAALTDTTDSD